MAAAHSPILGLHHVTATADDAQADLDFCVQALALRLVKKTVNFDNHHVYHFYYGNEHGTPGTLWTTFPYKGYGVRVGTRGAGQVTATAFSVPDAALEAWAGRLRDLHLAVRWGDTRFGDRVLLVRDPSGLDMELVGTARDTRRPWLGADLGTDAAIRGLHSVTMTVRSPKETLAFVTGELGFTVVDEIEGRIRVAVGGDGPGHIIDVAHAADAPIAVNGLGTVHHVAMAVATGEEQLQLRDRLVDAGRQVTPVRDRQYFTSIYFREPGGVLFEVATLPPGFTVDEPLATLGQALKLPPWEEPHRAAIEAGLPAITYR